MQKSFFNHASKGKLNGKVIKYTFSKFFIPQFDHKQAFESASGEWYTRGLHYLVLMPQVEQINIAIL